MSNEGNPHDSLFKAMCQNKQVALDLIKVALPQKLWKQLDTDSLQLTDKSFVSNQLKQYHSDLIYQVKVSGHEGYLVFLLEHQSSADRLLAFRKLEYNVGLMRQHLDQGHSSLPTIINIGIYHGRRSPYPYSTDLFACFSDEALAREWVFKPYYLIDLSVASVLIWFCIVSCRRLMIDSCLS